MIKSGDFTLLAKEYHHRPGYSNLVLRVLAEHLGALKRADFRVADVGAGTGKLTECLLQLGLHCVAVEPNDAMREAGISYTAAKQVDWLKGSAEQTGLSDGSADWVLMGSSFHWTDKGAALHEFHRVLRSGGHFTALWNPRDLARSELHMRIEQRIYEVAPNLERRSSGADKYTKNIYDDLSSTGHFTDVFFVEARHELVMSRERYMGAWRSVNDIPAQVGDEKFRQILDAISREITGLPEIVVPYKTRAWTARRV